MATKTLTTRLDRLEGAATIDNWRAYIGRPLDEWPGDAFVSCFEAGERFDRLALDTLARFSNADLLKLVSSDGGEG